MLRWLRTLWRFVRSLLGLDAQPKRKKLAPTSAPRRAQPKAKKAADPRVHVRYAPSIDGDPDPGEVVWAWVPFEDDPSRGKDRPVLIVGVRGNSLVAIPLTSKQKDRAPQVSVGEGAWDRERRTSYARVDRLLELSPADVRREGAIMPRDRFDAVVRALREWHGDAVIAR
jgi:PemK-like, MazF-like toxin of type II toxin-antitoxin system